MFPFQVYLAVRKFFLSEVIVLVLCSASMNAPVMVELEGETDPLEARKSNYFICTHCLVVSILHNLFCISVHLYRYGLLKMFRPFGVAE